MNTDTLRCLSLTFHWSPERPLSLRGFPGPLFRGALGKALRKRCVTGAPDCDGCTRIDDCSFGQLYERPTTPSLPKRFGTPPRPYVISPDQGTQTTFRLFGDATTRWADVIAAATEVRLFGRACKTKLWSPDGPIAVPTHLPLTHPDTGPSVVRLTLHTPTALMKQGRLATQVELPSLVSRLISRVDLLCMAYEGGRPSWDRHGIESDAAAATLRSTKTKVVSWKRTAYRSGKKVPMRGLMGEVVLENVTPRLWGVLQLARSVHVGRDAVFGFGRVIAEGVE